MAPDPHRVEFTDATGQTASGADGLASESDVQRTADMVAAAAERNPGSSA